MYSYKETFVTIAVCALDCVVCTTGWLHCTCTAHKSWSGICCDYFWMRYSNRPKCSTTNPAFSLYRSHFPRQSWVALMRSSSGLSRARPSRCVSRYKERSLDQPSSLIPARSTLEQYRMVSSHVVKNIHIHVRKAFAEALLREYITVHPV